MNAISVGQVFLPDYYQSPPYLEAKLVNRIICKSGLGFGQTFMMNFPRRTESDCSCCMKQRIGRLYLIFPCHQFSFHNSKLHAQKTQNSPTSEIIFFVLPQKGLLQSLKFFSEKFSSFIKSMILGKNKLNNNSKWMLETWR